MNLVKIDGPACPRCGCQDCHAVRTRGQVRTRYHGGQPVEEIESVATLRHCNACQRSFQHVAPIAAAKIASA